jgi:RNA polymerase sigma-70 factor (ECF subfamily)
VEEAAMDDQQTLDKARAGDARCFEDLVTPYRREIVTHCYRMLGSLSDADDLTQESLLRAWRAIGDFDGRASVRTWLYRIATNACLTEISRRPRRALPDTFAKEPSEPGPPPAAVMEAVWLEPCPATMWETAPRGPEAKYTAKESVAVAFLTVIQGLTPPQRAALIFRDVLGWSAAETAEALETSTASVNSSLQRAREALDAMNAAADTPKSADDGVARALLVRYVDAWESGDIDSIAALLREDAKLTMPPVPSWYSGRANIAALLGMMLGGADMRAFAGEASGQPAVFVYLRAPGAAHYAAQSLHVLAVDAAGQCARMDVFLDPRLFLRFDRPMTVDARAQEPTTPVGG